MRLLPFRSKVQMKTKTYHNLGHEAYAAKAYAKDRAKMEAAGWEVLTEHGIGVLNRSIVVTYAKKRPA